MKTFFIKHHFSISKYEFFSLYVENPEDSEHIGTRLHCNIPNLLGITLGKNEYREYAILENRDYISLNGKLSETQNELNQTQNTLEKTKIKLERTRSELEKNINKGILSILYERFMLFCSKFKYSKHD